MYGFISNPDYSFEYSYHWVLLHACNTLKLQASSQGSWKIRQSTHLSFVLIVDTTNTLALAPFTTLPGSPQ